MAEAATQRRAHDLKYPEAGTAAPQQMPGWVAGVPMKGGARDMIYLSISYASSLELSAPFVRIDDDALDVAWPEVVLTEEVTSRWHAALAEARDEAMRSGEVEHGCESPACARQHMHVYVCTHRV